MNEIIVCMVAYLAGSVNFSILLFVALKKGDPRARFSGNAGVTNVYRQAGVFWAGAVLVLDMARSAAVAAFALYIIDNEAALWAGLFLVMGNRFPLFHGFRGGKGVANYLGFTAFVAPAAAALSCAAWVIVYGVSRLPFVASFFMVATLASGTVMLYSTAPVSIAASAATAMFIVACHYENIRNHGAARREEDR